MSCKGWHQEAALRCLMNNLDREVAEKPDELIVYGGTGKAARNWNSFDAIVRSLQNLENDETGSWIYIGTQGIVQGTFETFASMADKHFGGDLRGKLLVSGGLGGMGGAQPLAATLNGAVFLGVEVDPEHIERRVRTGYCDRMARNLDEALDICEDARQQKRPVSIGLVGNCAEVLPEIVRRGIKIDAVTDQTSAHDPLNGYVPSGLSIDGAIELRRMDPRSFRPFHRRRDRASAHGPARLC